VASTYDLYNTSASTAAIMPQYFSNTNQIFTTTSNYSSPDPVMFAPAAPVKHKLSARDWLRERVDEMCMVGKEALVGA
jgi:hypothetical protein